MGVAECAVCCCGRCSGCRFPPLILLPPPPPPPLPFLNNRQVSSYAGPATESVGNNALTASFVASSAAVKCMSSFKVRRGGTTCPVLVTRHGHVHGHVSAFIPLLITARISRFPR